MVVRININAETVCCLHFWKRNYSTARYYIMIFMWLLLVVGVVGIFGYFFETNNGLADFWLPIFITIDVLAPLYIIWYFYIEWKVSPSTCCICC